MFITNTVLGGAGFSVPPGGEYQRTAAGYPLTLEKTLAKPPESIKMYGADGGVGVYDSTKGAYAIPIVFSDGTTDKTIYFYCDNNLPRSFFYAFLYPKTKKAYRATTDISALQDWEQDFTIPKADEVTVTAGNPNATSKLEIAYMSRKKN